MTNFTENYEQYSKEAVKKANQFIEKSKGLYTNEDMPAFIAGYLQACLKTPQTKPLSDEEIKDCKEKAMEKFNQMITSQSVSIQAEIIDRLFAKAIEERILGK